MIFFVSSFMYFCLLNSTFWEISSIFYFLTQKRIYYDFIFQAAIVLSVFKIAFCFCLTESITNYCILREI